MLKRRISKLRLGLNSKGKPNPIKTSCRYFLHGIPVLSIFALVGMISCSIISPSRATNEYKAYAAEADSGIMPLADTSASLTIDDGKIKDTIFATNGEFAYASHKVTISANTVKSVTLTLSRTSDLTGPSTVSGAGGKTPDQMDNAWGYAWATEGTDPAAATYQTLNASNTLTGVAPDSSHNVNTSRQLIFGAKFGSSAASGTYHAEATLSLVATPYTVVNYSISYNLNGGTSSAIAATTASDDTGAASKTLKVTSTVPTRSGYKFLGWATSSTGSVAYASGANITLQATNPTITLYAVWQQELTIKGITQMQQMYTGNDNGISSVCDATATGDTNTLTDTRDNSTYTVKKLANGQCWMTQNLRIAGKTITSANSDMTSGSFTIPASSTSGFSSSNYNNNSVYNGGATYGGYYSWYTATAGTGTQSLSSGDASSSICPKGWKLPKGGTITYTAASFKQSAGMNDIAAAINYTTANLSSNPDVYSAVGASFASRTLTVNGLTWPASGYYLNSTAYYVGTSGYVWSRTAYNGNYAYRFDFGSGYAYPAYYGDKYNGFSVRCVAYSN